MKSILIGTFLLSGLFLGMSTGHAYILNKLPPVWVVEPFTNYSVGSFPRRFRTYPLQRAKAMKVYRVAEEGENRFLRAHDEKELSVQILRQFYWQVKRFPWASWRWRPRILPAGADERPGKGGNDSACGVYILFGQYSGKALKYVWSTNAPRGTVVRKKPGKFHILVKTSGKPADPKAWQRVTINIPEEYRAQFDKELTINPTGFGVLTDGNAVDKPAACDYDDFTVAEHKPTP